MSEAANLVNVMDIAEMAGVTRTAVQMWKRRYPDFPKPHRQVTGRDVWLRSDVQRWLLEFSDRRLNQARAVLEAAVEAAARAENTLQQAEAFHQRVRSD